jgi:hypothetical protein
MTSVIGAILRGFDDFTQPMFGDPRGLAFATLFVLGLSLIFDILRKLRHRGIVGIILYLPLFVAVIVEAGYNPSTDVSSDSNGYILLGASLALGYVVTMPILWFFNRVTRLSAIRLLACAALGCQLVSFSSYITAHYAATFDNDSAARSLQIIERISGRCMSLLILVLAIACFVWAFVQILFQDNFDKNFDMSHDRTDQDLKAFMAASTEISARNVANQPDQDPPPSTTA